MELAAVTTASMPPPMNWMKKPSPNNPKTIDGTPARLFIAPRMTRVIGDVPGVFGQIDRRDDADRHARRWSSGTRGASVPKIIGKMPACCGSNIPSLVPPKMNRSEICAAPFQTMLPRMTTSMARMSSVAGRR